MRCRSGWVIRTLDGYLEFVEARVRLNTVLATASDLKIFFSVVSKEPAEVTSSDVLAFITAHRASRSDDKVVRLVDGEGGLSMQTIKRRLSSVSGLFSYLALRGDAGVTANPVPRGLATRNARRHPRDLALGRMRFDGDTDGAGDQKARK